MDIHKTSNAWRIKSTHICVVEVSDDQAAHSLAVIDNVFRKYGISEPNHIARLMAWNYLIMSHVLLNASSVDPQTSNEAMAVKPVQADLVVIGDAYAAEIYDTLQQQYDLMGMHRTDRSGLSQAFFDTSIWYVRHHGVLPIQDALKQQASEPG